MTQQRSYKPDGAELRRYLKSSAPFYCLQGPVRSGKSVASAIRIYLAMMAVPVTQGKRRSRWLVVRNSYPDLEQSTIKTWLEWFPEATFGRFTWSPPYTHEIRVGDVEADVVFESFAGDEDIPSLKSREYTGAWINEAQFYSLKFAVALYERTGWFPLPGGPKFLQLDMNAPPLGHWAPIMRGDAPIPEEMSENERRSLIKPEGWEFRVQPPWFTETMDAQGRVSDYVINPAAENLHIVGERAVYELLGGRTKDQIDADLMNRVTIQQAGRPVFPMFTRETHVAKANLQPVQGVTIKVGLDFGRQPAMVAAQQVGGRWFVLEELTASNMAAVTFAPMVRRKLASAFPGWAPELFEFWGDPSGKSTRGEVDDQTAFGIFKQNGMEVRAADAGNRRKPRIETATTVFNRMVDGQPACLVSPKCVTVVTGLAGGYVYRRKQVSGAPSYDEEPAKNQFSHPIDALLELFMAGGESRAMLGREQRALPVRTLHRVNPYGRRADAWARR